MNFIDLEFERDAEGFYDLAIENGDFKLTQGFETALLVSLFSDRRAYGDEVPDPLKRRGWIGDLVSGISGDKIGSGIWFYEQSRLTIDVENGVRSEANMSLQWAVNENLLTFVEADTKQSPDKRRLTLNITLTALNGGVTTKAFEMADATRTGSFVS